MIDMLKGKTDLGTIRVMIMCKCFWLIFMIYVEGFLFSILLNEQCFYMLLLLILWAKSIVFAILDALCIYAFQVLDARL